MHKGFCLAVVSALLLIAAGCTPVTRADEVPGRALTVFAAASLAEAFTEIAGHFERLHPGTEVVLNFAGSQQLAHQISQGAPADIFASADDQQMEAAVATGRIKDEDQQLFAHNQMIVTYPVENPAGLATLDDLTQPGLRLVVAASEVPAGRYAMAFLEKMAQDSSFGAYFKDQVMQNIVSYEENVRAVLGKVRLGEADAGIVYASDIQHLGPDEIGRLVIPPALNAYASYLIAPVNDSSKPLTAAFIDFVLSPEGQKVLEEHGFLPAAEVE